MDIDYTVYESARNAGGNAEEACASALVQGKDWTFCIRMLREVFEISLGQARDIHAKCASNLNLSNGS